MRCVITFAKIAFLIVLTIVGTLTDVASSNAQSASAEDGQLALNKLPATVRPYYAGYQTSGTLRANPYPEWVPPKSPVQFCFNDFYLGNSWHAALLAEYQKLVVGYAKSGRAKPDVIATNANADITIQLAQANSLVQQGCNVIVSVPMSPTGLCAAVQRAREKGVLFIAITATISCTGAIYVGPNDYYSAQRTANWLAQAMGGKGNLVLVHGVPGNATTVARRAGVMNVLGGYPGIHVLGEVTGMWSASIAKTAMTQFIATHPQAIDGIWDAGLQNVAAEQALLQAGRPFAKVIGMGTDCSFLAFWKEQKLDSFALSQGARPAVYEAFVVALRMLNGQKPRVNNIFFPLPEVTTAQLNDWYRPSMTVKSTCEADPPEVRAVPDSYFDAFFEGGASASVTVQP